MTKKTVNVSIAIKIEGEVDEYEKEVKLEQLEESIQAMAGEVGLRTLVNVIEKMDERMMEEVPRAWRNVGTETRWLVSSLGEVRYRRHIYIDEEKKRRKPIDEMMEIKRYQRVSGRVKEMGVAMAARETYRNAAQQLSWMIKTPVSHSSLQRMVWAVGNHIADGEEAERRRTFEQGTAVKAGMIAAPVLYAESDGVWVNLQREEHRSTEVRVAVMSTGKKALGKDRYFLENKCCLTTVGMDAQQWQEHILLAAHQQYDLSQTQWVICGGDGNQWVRHSFDRLDFPQEFVLDRFHLHRAAKRALKDRTAAKELVTLVRNQGFSAVNASLLQRIQEETDPRRKEQLQDFYDYLDHQQDGLLDLEYRNCPVPACLGAIEGNVDKLVVSRIKGRGRSWRLSGLRAMLALCRHAHQLQHHAYHYLPVSYPQKIPHRLVHRGVEYAQVFQKPIPVFSGPHQNRPWVSYLYRLIHGR